jgi:hypothetical protein
MVRGQGDRARGTLLDYAVSKRRALGLMASFGGATAATARSEPTAANASGATLNVLDFGVLENNRSTDNHVAFNRAIAAANQSGKMLYLPAGTYKNSGTLNTLTAPGLVGAGTGKTIIHHYTSDSCLVTRGSYMQLADMTLINKSPAGRGVADSGCFHVINCAYGRFTGLYAAHDLDGYAGILLEQRYDGSLDDAALLTHLGCWYNHFCDCTSNYVAVGPARGYGIRFRVAEEAIGVVDPPGQARGTYSGQCSYNIIDLANIEQRDEGLRLERGACNQIRGGQFLGSNVQVALVDSQANLFVGTRHNQWGRAAFTEAGASDDNVILYPSLFQVAPQPWSLGRLSRSCTVVRSDQKGGWVPHLTFGGRAVRTARASGSYVNAGGVVTVTWDIRLAERPSGGAMELGGLPFSAVNDPAEGVATGDLFILNHGTAPAAAAGRIGIGYCASTTITGFADHTQDLTAAHFGTGAIILGKMTYLTHWT